MFEESPLKGAFPLATSSHRGCLKLACTLGHSVYSGLCKANPQRSSHLSEEGMQNEDNFQKGNHADPVDDKTNKDPRRVARGKAPPIRQDKGSRMKSEDGRAKLFRRGIHSCWLGITIICPETAPGNDPGEVNFR